MKAIILAAGQGTRLRPLTDEIPKTMVRFRGKPLIAYTLEVLRSKGVKHITVVGGYRSEVLRVYCQEEGVNFLMNERYADSNMVETFFTACDQFDDDTIVAYSDIVFEAQVLECLLRSDAPISVVIDRGWKRLWQMRMDDPLSDAETLRLDGDGNIIELGKRPSSYGEIEGQYIGLMKFKKDALLGIQHFYASVLDRGATYDGKTFPHMFMTSFLQQIIDRHAPIQAVPIDGGWVEVDSVSDLRAYESQDGFPHPYQGEISSPPS